MAAKFCSFVLVLCILKSVNSDCGVFTKQEWDGLRPIHVEYLPRPVKLVIIMHTVTPTCNSNEGCAEIVRNIQTRHMDELKYWDIGESTKYDLQNVAGKNWMRRAEDRAQSASWERPTSSSGLMFLIGGNGKVFEGSGWLRVGAHTYRYNRKSIGISFIGNFNENMPTPEALAAARNLIKCGVERGHLAPDYHVVAHKQLIATESPGRKLYSEIRMWPDWLENADSVKNSRR